jgi:hypothetical protein
MFSGDGPDARLIRGLSVLSIWSHVGVVIVVNGRKLVTEAYPTIIDDDELRKKQRHRGVQTIDLRARLRDYPSHMVAFRPIVKRGASVGASAVGTTQGVSPALVRRFCAEVAAWRDEEVPQYSTFLTDFLEYGTRTDDDDNIHAGVKYYVCTSWAAHVLQLLQVLDNTVKPGNYCLSDFGFPNRQPTTLTRKWDFGQLYYCIPDE